MDFIEELSIIQIAFACMPSHFLPIMPKYVFWPYLSIQIYVCNLGSIWICFITVHSIQVVVFNSGTCFWFARFSVRMGNVDKNQFNVDGQVISVSQMYEHPDYTSSSSPYYVDMALLRLARPIYYNNRTRPICLATQRAGLQNCYVTGWGHSHFEGSTGKFIMKIEILFVFGCIDNQNHIHTTVWM